MEGKYTGIQTDISIIPTTIKTQLTPALSRRHLAASAHQGGKLTGRAARLNATISQEVSEALDLEMPSAKDWTEININRILMRVVAMASGRVFVGPELCRNEKYLTAAIDYSVDVMVAQRAVQEMRPWLRPFLARRLPKVKQVQRRLKEADEILRPVVEQRRRAAQDASYEKPDDMLQWLIDSQDQAGVQSSEDLARMQLLLSFAAIHTTTLTATNVFVALPPPVPDEACVLALTRGSFYDVASLPGFAAQVCDEMREALASNGGAFTSSALQSMKMLDSAFKETLRLHPPGLGERRASGSGGGAARRG